jgi:hypothetical protein
MKPAELCFREAAACFYLRLNKEHKSPSTSAHERSPRTD